MDAALAGAGACPRGLQDSAVETLAKGEVGHLSLMLIETFVPGNNQCWNLGEGRSGWVSVVVPVYNRSELVRTSLQSVLDQSYRPIELIVVDDGSRDDSLQVVRKWAKEVQTSKAFVIRVLTQANTGAPSARNRGILESTGEFLQFLDSDDLLGSEKIQIQVGALNAHPEADFAYGRVYDRQTPGQLIYGHSELTPERAILKQISSPTFTTLGPLCRRRMIESVGSWDESLKMCQDWEYHSRAAVLWMRGVFTPTAHAFIIRNGGEDSISWNLDPERTPVWYTARLRHLGSMWAYADQSLRANSDFRSTLASELMKIMALAVRLGCSVDDQGLLATSRELATRGGVKLFVAVATAVRRAIGIKMMALFVGVAFWAKYRKDGLKARLYSLKTPCFSKR